MRQFPSHSRQPRRGQALLLAVLIMIFAALLSASFITIVSVNLNQTARQADKNRAAASAKAGLDYVNRQLAFSAEGENWRPQIPNANLAAYYTPLDRAQGWAAGNYAKYPNPLDEQGINYGPQFLTKVERIPYTLVAGAADFDKAGQLKITVIGLSPEDPTAYSRTVFYKGGYQNAPLAQNMRVVSNWDFEKGVVPVAQSAGYVDNVANPRTVTLKNIKGEFPEPPFAVMIGDPITFAATGQEVRGAVVVKKDVVASVTTLRLAYPGANNSLNIRNNERIELAASIGAPNGLDYNNTGVPQAIPTAIAVKVADNATPGGLRINGGLWLTGKASAVSLRAPSDPNGAGIIAPGTIRASGLLARELDANPGGSPTVFDVQGQGISGTSTALLRSDQVSFPGGWAFPTGFTTAYDRRSKDQLVSDAWNRLAGVPSGVATTSSNNSTATRSVTSFIPPVLNSGEGLERYRNLTRFSPPAIPTAPASVSLYGGGQGIYIGNSEDRERILDGTTLRDMTQAEMVKMWVSRPLTATPTPDSYMRTGILNPANVNASLEEQHLRGWVGPDEFRARGVEIELGIGTLTITRDARNDGAANIYGGVADKTWKDAAGNNQQGVYSRTFDWPQNGVVFAEGNVRIRGNARNVPRSLTVVSMGNIYIEDSLSADADNDGNPATGAPRKVLLLATKNVVMNPTRALGRPDVQTTARDVAPTTFTVGTAATVTVVDASRFEIGDFVRASAPGVETNVPQGYVTGKYATPDPTDNDTLTINPTSPGVVTANMLVRTPLAPRQATLAAPFVAYNTIASGDDIVQRRINTPTALTAANPLRLAFNHGGDRPAATVFSVKIRQITPMPVSTTALLSHKRVLTASTFNPAATTVSNADKLIRSDYTNLLVGNGTDEFPTTAPVSQADAQLQTIQQIGNTMDNKIHILTGTPIWSYTTTVNTTYGGLPFFYLAGVGNRLEYGATSMVPATANEYREAISDSTTYSIPLATSIGVALNGVRPTISNETWNGTTYDATTQFGFNPTYQDVSALPATPPEDLLTADRSFYQLDAAKSTLDSRTFGAVNAGLNSLVLRRSDNLIGLGAATLPTYRTLGIKEENVTQPASSSSISTIDVGYKFNVNAYVYAQTGSWFVIPGGLFNNRLRSTSNATTGVIESTYFDINNDNIPDPGEYIDVNNSTTYDTGDFADLNRNGMLEDTERYAMARYSRYNYEINFTGAITENQTPIVNTMKSGANSGDPVVAAGSVEAWMNSWSTVVKRATDDPNTTTVNEAIPNFGRMTYTFDSDYVTGRVNETDIGFRLPQTTEVFNVS